MRTVLQASVIQLEACVPNPLNQALSDAVELGMGEIPANFASYPLHTRHEQLMGGLAVSDGQTLDELLDKTARRAADRLVAPTEVIMAEEAATDSTLVVVSDLPEPLVNATCDGIEAIVGHEIALTMGVPMQSGEGQGMVPAGEALDLASAVNKVRTLGYSVRTIVEGPHDWRKSRATVPLVVEHPRGVNPTGRSNIWWHHRSSTMRVRTPGMESEHAFNRHVLYDPETNRKFRQMLGYSRPGRIIR